MKFHGIRKEKRKPPGIDAVFLILAFAPLIFANFSQASWHNQFIQSLATLFSTGLFFAAAAMILKRPESGKILAIAASGLGLFAIFPLIRNNAAACLAGLCSFMLGLHFIADFDLRHSLSRAEDRLELSLQRAKFAALTLIIISFASISLLSNQNFYGNIALLIAAVTCQALAIAWSLRQPANLHKLIAVAINSLSLALAVYLASKNYAGVGSLFIGLSLYMVLPDYSETEESAGSWWEPLLNHPGRVTLATFFALCAIGTFLLMLPGAANLDISSLDAAFTSVSAVCVTGLIVLDTPNDFSPVGQFFILLLIQLGGLGIMTITTVAMHMLGRRLSLRQERLLNSAYNSDYQTLAHSLVLIVKFTIVLETVGAVILSLLFYRTDISFSESVWKGIFTSVSAFCNAGFALQSDSLIPFQNNAPILHTVALLIICGGIAPAVTLSIPRWLAGKNLPIASRIALVTTSILLITGTLFFLAFEWNGALAGLPTLAKLHNAWFQSVTLRTAGFNSIPLETVLGPTFLMMVCMMFIGGSPGGTAGGVKTTTIGVLAATFWSSAAGYDDISMQNRRILPQTVFKAVTIVAAGFMMLLIIVLMLEATQSLGARDLIFEAASALGTVGLSVGATAKLDSIGKIIIMFAMFAGRIGPLTLFTILSRERPANAENLLEARINLT